MTGNIALAFAADGRSSDAGCLIYPLYRLRNRRRLAEQEIMVAGGQHERIRARLLASYGEAGAQYRDQQARPAWKLDERARFLRRLQQENCRSLLEIGAGTGQDSLFFAEHGLDVLATDLSPAMVARCQAKGLNARAMDFSQPDLAAESFDAVHAMNCLLHVPNAELPVALAAIRQLLRPGGLLFVGVYGGTGDEGPLDGDDHVPPRFFSWRTDGQIQESARQFFDLVDFHVVRWGADRHGFQSLTLRRPGQGAGLAGS
jgi:SAM-dependent methyltransferase